VHRASLLDLLLPDAAMREAATWHIAAATGEFRDFTVDLREKGEAATVRLHERVRSRRRFPTDGHAAAAEAVSRRRAFAGRAR
jgi:hypothetical protein